MNDAILSLIADLYSQVGALAAENKALRAQLSESADDPKVTGMGGATG